MDTTAVKIVDRVMLRATDIELVEGCSRSTASRRLKKIRTSFKKEQDSLITIYEYANFLKVEVTVICDTLKLHYIAA